LRGASREGHKRTVEWPPDRNATDASPLSATTRARRSVAHSGRENADRRRALCGEVEETVLAGRQDGGARGVGDHDGLVVDEPSLKVELSIKCSG
jgi:hypothetical protein